jgi:uncharacterized protein
VAESIRSRLWPALAVGLAFCFAAAPTEAARVDGLYEAEAAFETDRSEGFRAALGKVLVRVTGRRDVTDRPDVQPLLQNAAAFAQQFRQPAPNVLWVSFDGAALERELAKLGQPVWGAERPSTLLWIAVDAGGGKRFVVASGDDFEEEAAIRTEVLEAARSRGVPMVFPLMDAEDRAQASFSEVWGGFEDAIRAASERYGVDAVLVGRLSTDDPDRGRWMLFAADNVERWTGDVAASVGRLSDLFAARFAVVSAGETRTVRLVVSGLESIEDYGRISSFLGSLTAVESLGVETVEGDEMVFRVALRGQPETLDEAARLGGLLRPDGTRPLSYRVAR